MLIWPAPGVSGDHFAHQLHEVTNQAYNVSGQGGQAPDVIRRYLRWVSDSHRLLRGVMRPADIRRLLLTDRYWATLNGTQEPSAIGNAILDEIIYLTDELRKRRLTRSGAASPYSPPGQWLGLNPGFVYRRRSVNTTVSTAKLAEALAVMTRRVDSFADRVGYGVA